MSKRFQFRHPGFGVSFLPTDLDGLTLWLDADDGATLKQDSAGTTPAGGGDVVGLWQDKSGNGFDFSQATTASKPVRRADGLEFDQSDDFLSNSDTISAVSDYTMLLAIEPSALTNSQYLFDTSAGRLIIAFRAATVNSEIGYFDGAWHEFAAGTTDNQILSYMLTSGGAEIFRNGQSLGTDTYTQKAISSTTTIGSTNQGTGGFFAGLIKEVLFYTGEKSTSERQQLEAYLAKKWGITL